MTPDNETITVTLTREQAHALAFKTLPISYANDDTKNLIFAGVLAIEIALFPDKGDSNGNA